MVEALATVTLSLKNILEYRFKSYFIKGNGVYCRDRMCVWSEWRFNPQYQKICFIREPFGSPILKRWTKLYSYFIPWLPVPYITINMLTGSPSIHKEVAFVMFTVYPQSLGYSFKMLALGLLISGILNQKSYLQDQRALILSSILSWLLCMLENHCFKGSTIWPWTLVLTSTYQSF